MVGYLVETKGTRKADSKAVVTAKHLVDHLERQKEHQLADSLGSLVLQKVDSMELHWVGSSVD